MVKSIISVSVDLSVAVTSIITSAISLAWSVPSGVVAGSNEVTWQALSDSNGSPLGDDEGLSGTSGSINSTSYTVEGLEINTVYNITVRANTAFQGSGSESIITFIGKRCWYSNRVHSGLYMSFPLQHHRKMKRLTLTKRRIILLEVQWL